MDKAWIGIDPGQNGAACLLVGDRVEFYDFEDVSSAAAWIDDRRFELVKVRAVLERVHSMPKQGVASSFKFGANFGAWQGILSAFRIPFEMPTPRQWQKGIIVPSDGPDPKSRSLAVARRLYPQAMESLKRKKDADRADALLMAHWGMLRGC